MLEEAAIIKTFEYSLLGKKLKSQPDIAKKQYQNFDGTFEFDKIIKKERPTLENYGKLVNLIYNSKYGFYNYYGNSKKIITFPQIKVLFSSGSFPWIKYI